MALASQEAQRYKFGPQKISSLHILLGIAREGTGVACVVLRNLEIDLEKVHRECEKRLKRIKIIRKEEIAEEVTSFAIEKARSLNHNYVGTEHLLLGILLQESRGAQILKNLGLKTENVQAEILSLCRKEDYRFSQRQRVYSQQSVLGCYSWEISNPYY